MENRSLHIAESFIEASNTLINGAVLKAGFDKTIKANIKQLLDKPTGKYKVKYQDSQFQAFATSADIHYEEGQEVSVLIPGNDWDRDKTIVGSRPGSAMTYKQMPITDQQYNAVGPNGISIRVGEDSTTQQTELYRTGVIGIRSGLNESFSIKDFINISDIKSYIIKGNCIALNMMVRTDFGASQVGGNYGLRFALKFKDPIATTDPENPVYTIKSFTVSDADLFGNPYQVNVPTSVSTLITNIDTENFESIQDIYVYTEGFPQFQGEEFQNCPVDIFISGIGINGGISLTEEELEGYIVHINDPDGGVLKPEEEDNPAINIIKLIGELKVHGQLITQNVDYYWFIQNGTVFQGMDQYSGHAGEGWQCLNPKVGTTFSPFKVPYFYFAVSEDVIGQDLKESKNYFIEDLCKKVKVCCVAFYQGKNIKGEYIVTNENISTDITIDSSQKKEGQNKTQYYLGNGHPTLHCIFDQQGEHEYVWTIKPANDSLINQTENSQVPKFTPFLKEEDVYYTYLGAKTKYEEYLNELSLSDGSEDAAKAITEPFDWESEKDKEYIDGQYYINFPINSIINSTKITCAVYSVNQDKTKTYRGSASITLYNKMQLQGQYSLSIINGTQIFQYDEKGNSPFVEQVDRKPMEAAPDLGFTLLDNSGTQISYNQIVQYGSVRWLFPKNETLLIQKDNEGLINEEPDLVLNSTDTALAADFYIFKNIPTFSYTIEDRYSLNKTNNNIGLLVNFKDVSLETWTDFTFPKNGDPGTNGTNLIAKIIPRHENNDLSSDRIYAVDTSWNGNVFFTDSGADVDNLRFFVVNNNNIVYDNDTASWSCPPKTIYGDNGQHQSQDKGKTYIKYTNSNNQGKKLSLSSPINVTIKKVYEDKPINIVRGQYGLGKDKDVTKYYAECPICYEHFTQGNGSEYRIKVKPKTGFKYVTYAQDGTRPDYDSAKPFEIIVERHIVTNQELKEGYYTKQDIEEISCGWRLIGNLLIDEDKNEQSNISGIIQQIDDISFYAVNGNKCYIKPADQFNGYDLSSAILIKVKFKDKTQDNQHEIKTGFIHIPIYMNLNRYGNNAINGWDGNSIDLGTSNNSTILAPQVGAGKKDDNNTFTGVLIGEQLTSSTSQTGLFGYYKGQRSIFLDAETGKAQFGKTGAAKIILDPSSTMNVNNKNKDVAFIYSDNFNQEKYRNNSGVLKSGDNYINYQKTSGDGGMMLDLTSPQIVFANGKFNVSSTGGIHSQAGDIAGWQITDTKLYKGNTGMSSTDNPVTRPNETKGNPSATVEDTKAFYAGAGGSPDNFYVTHQGYLYSKSGQIAGWNLNSQSFWKQYIATDKNGNPTSTVTIGINSDPNNSSYGVTDHKSKAFFANGDNFYVTHDGYLRSTSGKIAVWDIGENQLQQQDGQVGMGSRAASNKTLNEVFKSNLTENKNTTLRFWAGTGTTNKDLKFAVDSDGKLYSNDGFIAGWRIGQTALTSDGYETEGTGKNKVIKQGITINKDGSISGPGWNISAYGDASFNHLHGKIDGLSDQNQSITVSITGGSMTSASGGGSGYALDSDGHFCMGSGAAGSGANISYDGDKFYVGQWKADGQFFYHGEQKDGGITLSSAGLTIGSADKLVSAAPGELSAPQVFGKQVQSPDFAYITSKGGTKYHGQSGRATFSDGSYLEFKGGILTAHKAENEGEMKWSS